MEILKREILDQCVKKHARSKAWILSIRKIIDKPQTNWRSYQDILKIFPTATAIPTKDDFRIKFNHPSQKFRIIARVDFDDFTLEIRFAGTHAEYDKIDANTV